MHSRMRQNIVLVKTKGNWNVTEQLFLDCFHSVLVLLLIIVFVRYVIFHIS